MKYRATIIALVWASTQTVFASLLAPSADVRSAATKAVAKIHPAGALPRLSQALEQYPSQFVLDTIALYRAEALPYLPQLEKLAANEAVRGDLRDRARKAIEAIKNPNPEAKAKPKVKAVALADANQPQAPALRATPAGTPAPAQPVPTGSLPLSSPAPTIPESPAPLVERKSPVWLWLVGIVVLAVIGLLVLRNRT